MSVEVRERAMPRTRIARPRSRSARKSAYPYWFYLPAFVVFFVFFLLPTFSSFYYSLTRWTLFDSEFIGLENFRQFFEEPALTKGLTNTLIYAVTTSGAEGDPRDAAGRAADLERDRPGVHALGRLLPGAGQHDRRRAHLHGADGARRGPDQRGAGRRRDRGAALAGGPEVGADVGGAGRRLEGRRAGDGDLHRRDRVGPARVLRRRHASTARRPSSCFATSRCRSPGRPR